MKLRRKTLDIEKVKDLISDKFLATIQDPSECHYGEIQKDDINIYEFAFRCKSYLLEFNYFLETRYIPDFDKFRCIIHYTCDKGYENIEVGCISLADTEVEVILEASNWVLENKKVTE